MDADVAVHEVRELVTSLVKTSKGVKTVTQAIKELEAVHRNAIALGCEVGHFNYYFLLINKYI
jgi:hypothetical protein